VSKFNKVSIFSGLNNLTDIAVDAWFFTIPGMTRDDGSAYFMEYTEVLWKILSRSLITNQHFYVFLTLYRVDATEVEALVTARPGGAGNTVNLDQ
jgi:hypothetical protein